MNFSSIHHSFDIDIASAYGVEEAILIHHFQHWIRVNRRKNHNIRDGKCWTYQSRKQILSYFPYFNFERIRNLCERLVSLKILITRNYNKNSIDKTLWYAFADEKKFGVDEENSKNVYERENSLSKGKIPTPIPDSIYKASSSKSNLRKGNAYQSLSDKAMESGHCRALPPSIEKKKKAKENAGRIFPRSEEHERKFQWLLSLKLDTNEETLSFWSHKYSAKKLQDTWDHIKHKQAQGCVYKSLGAIFRTLLLKEASPVNEKCLKNKELAKKFRDWKGWPSLELKERYCCDSRRPDYDIPYLLDEQTFMKKLEDMWDDLTAKRFSPHHTDNEDYEDDYDD